MIFANLDDLLHMNGHGTYVWAAYGVTITGLVLQVLLPLLARRRLLLDIRRRAQRDAASGARLPESNSQQE